MGHARCVDCLWETTLSPQINRSAILFGQPGLNIFFFWDFADAFDLAVNNNSWRTEHAVAADLSDVGNMLDISRHIHLAHHRHQILLQLVARHSQGPAP